MPIEVKNLSYAYMQGGPLAFPALKNVTLTIGEGEFLGVIGHTGSGKSTLMQHLNGLLVPSSGSVLVDGLNTLDKKQRITARRLVGMVFQYPEYQLFDETVLKDVSFGPRNMGLGEKEAAERAREALSLVGLDPDRFAAQSPFDLSGGEKRRAALAGILSMKPKYLVLDEPMAGLDPRGRKSILDLVEGLRRSAGCAVIMVSHSMDDVARFSQRVAVLDHGELAMLDTPENVFSQADALSGMGLSIPQSTRLAALLAQKGWNVPRGICRMEELEEQIVRRGYGA